MKREQINKINVERLTRWKDRLNEQHSTPIMLLGVGHDQKEGQLVVLVTEERTDAEILLFMEEALRVARASYAKNN